LVIDIGSSTGVAGGGGVGAGVGADRLNSDDVKKDANRLEPSLMIAAGVGIGGGTNPVATISFNSLRRTYLPTTASPLQLSSFQ